MEGILKQLLYIQIVKQEYLNFFHMEKHRGNLMDISILIWKTIVYQGNMWDMKYYESV